MSPVHLRPWAGFALGIGVFLTLETCASRWIGDGVSPLTSNMIFKGFLAALSLGVMGGSPRRFSQFGFRRPSTLNWKGLVAIGMALGGTATALILATPAKGMQLLVGASLPGIILAIWIISSASEEIFCRGWIQTWIGSRREEAPGGLMSPAVLTSGLLFGALHLTLLRRSTDLWTVAIIVAATTLLGLAAGFYRERSQSLWPAFVIHVAFNVGGFLAGVAFFITHRLVTGAP